MARKRTRMGRQAALDYPDQELIERALAMTTFDPRLTHELACRKLLTVFCDIKNNVDSENEKVANDVLQQANNNNESPSRAESIIKIANQFQDLS